MYKLVKDPTTKEMLPFIIRLPSTFIPAEESNPDYQIYLEWVAEGNKPEPADE